MIELSRETTNNHPMHKYANNQFRSTGYSYGLPSSSLSSSSSYTTTVSKLSVSKSWSWSVIYNYSKYLSPIFIALAFVVATIVIPYQQRQLFSSTSEGHSPNQLLTTTTMTHGDSHYYMSSGTGSNDMNTVESEDPNKNTFDDVSNSGIIVRKSVSASSNGENTTERETTIRSITTTTTVPALKTSHQKVEETAERDILEEKEETMTVAEIKRNIGSSRMPESSANRTIPVVEIEDQDIANPQQQKRTESGHVVVDDSVITSSSDENYNGIIARPFQPWPEGTRFPCYPPTDDWESIKVQFAPSNRGFLYVKPYKTGSSTTSGVHLRIARNVAQRQPTGGGKDNNNNTITICDSRFDHGPDFYPGYSLYRHRILDESFLWSIIRHPTQRAISQFFHFEVSREKIEPTDDNFIHFIEKYRTKMMQDYYYKALYTNARFNRKSIQPVDAANHILSSYNFIGLTERLDESLVVLMMLLDLRMADILYLSAKTNGGYDDAGGRDRVICTYIWPSFVSPGVNAFLNGTVWQDTIQNDLFFYAAVNRSLDMTIDSLGRATFNENLQKFQHAQRVAHVKCSPTVVFPCDNGGTYHETTDCIWKDSGCGTTCLDDVAAELHLW